MAVGVREVAGLRCEVSRVTGALDPALLDVGAAVRVLEHVVAMRNMLAAVEAEVAAKVAETERWRRAGFRSAEEWLASKTGTSKPHAAGNIATGRRMREQAKVAAAARAGQLSAEQARAVTEAAAANPAAEERLVAVAGRSTLNELRDECQRTRATADPGPRRRTPGSGRTGTCGAEPTERAPGTWRHAACSTRAPRSAPPSTRSPTSSSLATG